MSVPTEVDPITVEVIGNQLLAAAEEMGVVLVKAAYSTNIKERQDCSTAILDPQGQAVAQAEHIPMHLGSMLGLADDIRFRSKGDRNKHAPWGLFGGLPGGKSGLRLNPDRPDERALGFKVFNVLVRRGDVLELVTPGGGGHGDPRQRDPVALAQDVQAGKVSPRMGREMYGSRVKEQGARLTQTARSARPGQPGR